MDKIAETVFKKYKYEKMLQKQNLTSEEKADILIKVALLDKKAGKDIWFYIAIVSIWIPFICLVIFSLLLN